MALVSECPETAQNFLQFYAPEGPWKLTAINSAARGIKTKTFTPGGEVGMLRWAFDLNRDLWNLYFELGLSDPTKANKKSSKKDGDMIAARSLWADLDCGPERVAEVCEKIAKGELAPGLPRASLMIFSGNGVWPVWLLGPATEDLEGVENINKAMIPALAHLWADQACWNADRIARLPGSINYPDKKKAARGRVQVLSGWSPL